MKLAKPGHFASSLANNTRLRIARGVAIVGTAVGSAMTASAQETGGSSAVDAAVTAIVDTVKTSLNTTVGKAMTIGVILLLAAASWRAIKRLTS